MRESLDFDGTRASRKTAKENSGRKEDHEGVNYEGSLQSGAERVRVMALVGENNSGSQFEREMEGTSTDTHAESSILPTVALSASLVEKSLSVVCPREHSINQSLKAICPLVETTMEENDAGLASCTPLWHKQHCDSRTFETDSKEIKKRRKYTYHTRPRGKTSEPSSLKRRRFFESRSTKEEDFAQWTCCKSLSCFQRVDLKLFRDKREYLLAASQQKRKDFLSTLLRGDGKFEFDQRRVCAQFLLLGFGFSKDLQRAVKGTYSIGSMEIEPEDRAPGANAHQRNLILEFLEQLVSSQMASQGMTDSVSFPFFRKKHIYRLLLRQMKAKRKNDNSPNAAPSFCYFVSTWNKYYSRVKLEQGMGCDLCAELQEALNGGNILEKTKALNRRTAHYRLIERERASYLTRKNMGNTDPRKACSIAIGGLQQGFFSVPHFWDFRLFENNHSIKANVVGLLENGPQSNLELFVHVNQFPMSCSILIEIVHRFVNRSADEGNRSKVLFIDVNIMRAKVEESYFLSYLECLVAWGVFEEIQVFFSLPGHVHSDLQLGARCTAEALSKGDILTLDALEKQLRLSQARQANVSIISNTANFAGLLEQESSVRKVESTTSYRLFRFYRSTERIEDGTGRFSTSCLVRKSCMEDWKPLFHENPSSGLVVKAPDLRLTPAMTTTVRRVNESSGYNHQESEDIPFNWDLQRCVEGRESDFSRVEVLRANGDT